MRCVFGIGNPGFQYTKTRHNIGFRVLDAIAARRGLAFRKIDRDALEARDQELVLVKPLTYVNRSGRAFEAARQRDGLECDQVLVVVDDVNLEFGRLRLRAKGRSGGHNGLKDISAVEGSDAWPRLRMGVGAKVPGSDLAEHVLGEFDPEEETAMALILDRAIEVAEGFVAGRSLEVLMADCNRAIDGIQRGGGAGVQKEK